jgi:opacity protein-like surface antigen
MTTTSRWTIVLLLLLIPGAVSAQVDRGASAGGSVSATNLDSRTSWSFAGSFEYRFNRVAGLELEATAVPTLKSDFFDPIILSASASLSSVSTRGQIVPTIFPPPRITNQQGRAVIFTNNVRVHIPTTTERLDPYFVAGGGIASIRHTADYIYSPLTYTVGDLPGGLTVINPSIPISTITEPIASASTALALTLGGGLGVRVVSSLWIEADLRLFRLLGSEDRNAGRFGVGVRYRF